MTKCLFNLKNRTFLFCAFPFSNSERVHLAFSSPVGDKTDGKVG